MRRSIEWALVAVLGWALPAVAAEPAPEVPVIGETIDVRVVNVEAVVTDASGERVRGLTAADFRLRVDGQEVPIEYFSEVAEGTVAAPGTTVAAGEEVGRSYLVYLDDSFALANRRNDLLEKMERDLALLRPADRMALLAFDGAHVDVLCGWTGDAAQLREALQRARRRPVLGHRMVASQGALQADVDWMAVSASSLDSGDSDRVGGPKVGEMDEIYGALSHRIPPEARTQLGKTAATTAAALRGFETPPGRKVLLLVSGAWSLSVAPRLYGPLVEAANRLGYTLYPVDAAQSDATEVTALDGLARATGGRALVSMRNEVFRQVVADTGSYYGLGFTPAWKANDQGHAITVEARRSGLQVRSRAGFTDVSARTETAREAESVLLFGGVPEDRRLFVELGKPARKGKVLQVPVTLGVPVEALALTPQGSRYLAEVPLAVAAEDVKGQRADLPSLRLQVEIPAVPPARTYARFQTVLGLRDAAQHLIFTVRDPVSGRVLWGQAELEASAPGRRGK